MELSSLDDYLNDEQYPGIIPERVYQFKPMAPDFRAYQKPCPEQHYSMLNQQDDDDYFSHY